MAYIEVQPNGCWWFTGCLDKSGYGHLGVAGKVKMAHRVAYEELIGPIPKDRELDHTCHKKEECRGGPTCPHRRCCNPRHLEPVDHLENTRRGHCDRGLMVGVEIKKSKTHCPQGHEYTPENTHLDKRKGRHCLKCATTRAMARYYRLKSIQAVNFVASDNGIC